MKTIVWVIVAIILLGGGWMVLKGNNSGTDTSGPIKIGFVGPLTGDAASYGEADRNSVMLAVDEINAAGGIGGRQIQIVYEDGKCDGTTATNAVQKLISADGVQAILGGFCSGETIPSVPIVAQNKVLLLSGSASSPVLTGINPYFSRDYPSDSMQGKVLADYAQSKGWKNVAVIQEQTDYSAGLFKSFNDSFTALGGKTTNESFPTKTTDFRSIITKLKGEKPDALFVASQDEASGDRVLKQLAQLGWNTPLMVSDVVISDVPTLKGNAKVLEGAVGAEFLPDPSNSAFKHVLDAYKAKYNVDVPYQGYVAAVYDTVYMLRDGIKAVGYNGEKLAAWTRTVANWPGASGSVTIDSKGDRAGGFAVETVHNGVKQAVQ